MADTANRVEAKAPAFPATRKETYTVNDGRQVVQGVEDKHYPGINLRTYLAAKAMQGFVSGVASQAQIRIEYADVARGSVAFADALISALNNAEQKGANP